MIDTVVTLIVTLVFLVAAAGGILVSLNELRSSNRDGKLLDQLEVANTKRDIVKSEWWRHAVRLVGFTAFTLVAVIFAVITDLTQDITAGRLMVRVLLAIGLVAVVLVAYIDRWARQRLMDDVTKKPADHPRRRRDD